jgi:hypothetical protein
MEEYRKYTEQGKKHGHNGVVDRAEEAVGKALKQSQTFLRWLSSRKQQVKQTKKKQKHQQHRKKNPAGGGTSSKHSHHLHSSHHAVPITPTSSKAPSNTAPSPLSAAKTTAHHTLPKKAPNENIHNNASGYQSGKSTESNKVSSSGVTKHSRVVDNQAPTTPYFNRGTVIYKNKTSGTVLHYNPRAEAAAAAAVGAAAILGSNRKGGATIGSEKNSAILKEKTNSNKAGISMLEGDSPHTRMDMPKKRIRKRLRRKKGLFGGLP